MDAAGLTDSVSLNFTALQSQPASRRFNGSAALALRRTCSFGTRRFSARELGFEELTVGGCRGRHRDRGEGSMERFFCGQASAGQGVFEGEAPPAFNTRHQFKTFPGQAYPLGVSEVENGINFAIFSQHATSVTLCVSFPTEEQFGNTWDGMIELTLDPRSNRTGNIWHIFIEDFPRSNVLYGYRVDGPRAWHDGHRFDNNIILIDPYAKLVEGRRYFGDAQHKMSNFLGTFNFDEVPFDWGASYKLPKIHEKDLVVYEMNVRAFTADDSSGLDAGIRGSYLGVIEKIPHLLELGINAVELLPVFEYDEFEFQRRPNPREHLVFV